MFSSVKPRQISSLELHKYEINTRTPTVEQHLIAQAQSWPKLKSDCMFQTMFVLLSNRKYKFIPVLQEIFQGKRYKIELLPDDDDGLCIVHQLTITIITITTIIIVNITTTIIITISGCASCTSSRSRSRCRRTWANTLALPTRSKLDPTSMLKVGQPIFFTCITIEDVCIHAGFFSHLSITTLKGI